MVKTRNDYDLTPNKKHIQHLKVKLFIILFIILTASIYSEENTLIMDYSYSLLNIYNGFNITEDGASYEFTGNLVNFNIVNENTGIGIDISPIRYFYSYSPQLNIWSFVNIYLYWDIFSVIYGRTSFLQCGPFFSINWLNKDDISPFNINKKIFSTGLKFSLGVAGMSKIWGMKIYNTCRFIDIETGYRNIYGKHSFFLTIQFNPIGYIAMIGARF